MKFRDIAIKNFKVNFKKYLSYFLCSSFSIMLFFMYANLLFNESIKNEGNNQEMINILFYMSLAVIALFAVFFINYAHTSFIKSRYKEFGIYLSLGMTEKDIGKIVLIENIIIIVSSLFFGLLSGLIFSRLFQMVVAAILDVDQFVYALNGVSFLLTVGIFAVIFLFVLLSGRSSLKNIEIGELLKKSRRNEAAIEEKILPGLAGLGLLALSLLAFIMIAGHERINSNFLIVIPNILLIFAGTYTTISYIGVSAMALIKRNNSRYYQHLLLLTELAQKFKQNRKIIFTLSILSSMIVFLVASPFSLLSLTEKLAEINQPNDLEFSTAYGVNEVSDERIADIIRKTGGELVSQNKAEYLALDFSTSGKATDLINQKPAIKVSEYNLLTGSSLEVPEGTVYNAITTWVPGNTGIAQGDTLFINTAEGTMGFAVLDSARAPWVTSGAAFPSVSGLVFNDRDYLAIRSKVGQESICTYHMFDLQDWKTSEETVHQIKDVLAETNGQNWEIKKENIQYFALLSKIEVYQTLKQAYSLFIFISSIMGILFFIAAGSVLFFKQYTEIDEAKQKYYKLFKIGIQEKEAKGIMTKELLITFFIPLVFGSIMGFAFIYFMTNLVGGADVLREFMLNATKVVLVYFAFQAFFFFITRKKYLDEVLAEQ